MPQKMAVSEGAELLLTGQPTFSSLLIGLYIFSQCPQTLTAGAEVWVGAHYSLAEPCQKEGGFFKGSKLRFSFFGYFISYGRIHPHALFDLFHVSCVPPAAIFGPLTLKITSVLLDSMDSPPGCAYFTEIVMISLCILLRKSPNVWRIVFMSRI